MIPCWCGNTVLEPFSPSYRRCSRCQTLVSQEWSTQNLNRVVDDSQDFYGKDYWLGHQANDLGFPDLFTRARTDLPERCLHWLRTLLKYKLPPAKTLELGSAHGGSVAMWRWAGFDAMGLELSPWVVEFSRRTFGVPTLVGPVEEQALAPASLDVIVLMDVLEHLPDPLKTMQHCLQLLKPDGIFLIQTPLFRPGTTYDEMQRRGDRFLELLQPDEHLYLFSQQAVVRFFRRVGADYIAFEPAIFAHYDMFLAVSRAPFSNYEADVIEQALSATAGGRLIQALLDLDAQHRDLKERYAASEQDRAARLENLQRMEHLLRKSEDHRAEQANVIQQSQQELARLRAEQNGLHQHVDALTAKHHTLTQQLSTLGAERQTLTQQVGTLQTERQTLTQRVGTLQIKHEALMQELQATEQRWSAQHAALQAENQDLCQQAGALETERQALTHQLHDIRQQCEVAEAERHLLIQTLQNILDSRTYRLLQRFGRWKWVKQTAAHFLSSQADVHALSQRHQRQGSVVEAPAHKTRIAVDLTPLLPGSANGGAKIMTLELLRHLSKVAPELEFVLLTSDASHDELAVLDCANVWRLCVLHHTSAAASPLPLRTRLKRQARDTLTTRVPHRILTRMQHLYRLWPSFAPRNSLLRHLNVDLLFCPFTAPFYSDPSVPIVSVIYDIQYLYYPEFFSPEERHDRDKHFRDACRLANRLVCISDFVRQTVLEQAHVPPAQVTTAHIRLSHRLATPTTTRTKQVLEHFGLSAGQFLVYPANFWPHKNHHMLLTAFGMYQARHTTSALKLVCTGTPDAQMTSVCEAAARMGLANRTVFPGYMPDDEFQVLLHECLALIFPSLYEGFGMPILEAMACGKPVLCSDVTSLPEIAGDAVLFFDPRKPSEILSAIERVENDFEFTQHLIRQGQQRFKLFSDPAEMAQQYLHIFHDAMNSPLATRLHGVYDDGWTSDHVVLTYGANPIKRSLELELSVPPFCPHKSVSVRVVDPGNGQAASHVISREHTMTIRHLLPPHDGSIEIMIDPAFRPKAYEMNNDNRILGCLCTACRIVSSQGNADLLAKID